MPVYLSLQLCGEACPELDACSLREVSLDEHFSTVCLRQGGSLGVGHLTSDSKKTYKGKDRELLNKGLSHSHQLHYHIEIHQYLLIVGYFMKSSVFAYGEVHEKS